LEAAGHSLARDGERLSAEISRRSLLSMLALILLGRFQKELTEYTTCLRAGRIDIATQRHEFCLAGR
jgi:hypothetical protein